MKHKFYDAKLKKSVEAEVTEKVTYGDPERPRYGFKAIAEDGRKLSTFVNKETYDSCKL